MFKFLKNIKQYFKKLKFVKEHKKKIQKEGALLNSFTKKKCIFIHIPKTAGISVVKAFFGDVTLEGHRSVLFYQKVFGKQYSDFFTFTIVRNPWERLYSAYKFLEKGGVNIHDQNAFRMHLSKYKNFEDFVINGLNDRLIFEITHLIPQSEFICNNKGTILVDYVGRFESLQEDIAVLSKKINSEIVMDHHNQNTKKSYTEIYTEEMILKVKKIYWKDINTFEYNFK